MDQFPGIDEFVKHLEETTDFEWSAPKKQGRIVSNFY